VHFSHVLLSVDTAIILDPPLELQSDSDPTLHVHQLPHVQHAALLITFMYKLALRFSGWAQNFVNVSLTFALQMRKNLERS